MSGYPKKPPMFDGLLVLRYIMDHPGCSMNEMGAALYPEATHLTQRRRVAKHLRDGRDYWFRQTHDTPMKHYIVPAGLERLASDETPRGDVELALKAMEEAGWVEQVEPGLFRIKETD